MSIKSKPNFEVISFFIKDNLNRLKQKMSHLL